MLKHFSRIRCAGSPENSNGTTLQIAKNRRQAAALVMHVIGLVLLVAIKLNIGRIHIQKDATVTLATNLR